jgi:hypothetical protein
MVSSLNDGARPGGSLRRNLAQSIARTCASMTVLA